MSRPAFDALDRSWACLVRSPEADAALCRWSNAAELAAPNLDTLVVDIWAADKACADRACAALAARAPADSGTESAVLSSGAARYVLKGGDIAVLVAAASESGPYSDQVASMFLTPDASSAAAARRFTQSTCERWRCDDLVDSAGACDE
ncbi:MAG: hypothetical protein M3P34_08315 [Actinomycetota bacterium]|nr:hypothetical protein [Actinomycetota bacterium]